jgi:hypothetical protein
MQYATVDSSNTVVNVILWDGVTPYDPGDGFILIQSDNAQIGDVWDGQKFNTPVSNS